MMYYRRRKRRKVGHADDWLMTYADMITLLLCFFVLFAAISISQKKNAAKVPVANREEKAPESAKPELPAVCEVLEQAAEDRPDPAPEIVDSLESEPAEDLKQGGDRITSLEMSSAAFFDRGSATLSPAGKAILRDLAGSLKADKFKDYEITVEGHTDDAPISTSLFPSNWELSTARAAAVVRFFLEEGIPAHRLRAAGYADTFPKAPNRDASGAALPENQAQNRRVVIKLEKIEKTT